MGYRIKKENEAKALALAGAGVMYMSFHNAVGGRQNDPPVLVNLLDKRTEMFDMSGYGIVRYGDPIKVSRFSSFAEKRNIRVDGIEYLRLVAVINFLTVTDLIEA